MKRTTQKLQTDQNPPSHMFNAVEFPNMQLKASAVPRSAVRGLVANKTETL
jgi:hypothetical protein